MISKFDSNSLKEGTWLKGENEICSDLLSGVFSIESQPGDVLIFQVDPEMCDLTEADSVGLGKTFSALAVIKYYE